MSYTGNGADGTKGYKMSKIARLEAGERDILVHLECGHVRHWLVYVAPDEVATDAIAEYLEDFKRMFINSRMRCNECREVQE